MSYGRSMYGPDPYGYDPAFNTPSGGGYSYPGEYDDMNPWLGILSQGISAAQDVARVAVGGYPPQDIYAPVYAPQYPAQPGQPMTPAQMAQAPHPGGIQISTTTLMLFVGGVLLFMLGKRGR